MPVLRQAQDDIAQDVIFQNDIAEDAIAFDAIFQFTDYIMRFGDYLG